MWPVCREAGELSQLKRRCSVMFRIRPVRNSLCKDRRMITHWFNQTERWDYENFFGTDFSSQAERAIKVAASLAAHTDSPLTLVHAVEPGPIEFMWRKIMYL